MPIFYLTLEQLGHKNLTAINDLIALCGYVLQYCYEQVRG